MDTKLDNQSVIIALTAGVGAHLGRRTRASFFELQGRLPRVTAFAQLDDASKQQVVDMLALATFYSVVVFPLEAGSSFVKVARTAGATHVRIGRDQMDARFGSQMRGAVSAFYKILSTSHIPVTALSFSTLSEFVENIVALGVEREREALDRQKDSGGSGGRVR